jgi:hypothetical protein
MSYYEDEYVPTLNEEFDDFQYIPEHSVDSDSTGFTSVSASRKRIRNLYDESKKIDKGYHKLKTSKYEKSSGIEVYSTNSTPGSMIRDAITGARNKEWLVGSKNERIFFKVALTYGHTNRDSLLLYFDSPEQFERHMGSTVSQITKEKWTGNCANASPL